MRSCSLLLASLTLLITWGCSTPKPPDTSAQDDPLTSRPVQASPEVTAPSKDDDAPPAPTGIPQMPEGMLYIGYFFDNPGGDATAPKLDEPLRRVPGDQVVEALPAYIFDDEAAEHLGPPVDLDHVSMQVAYPMGEAAIIDRYGEETNMVARRTNMTCHMGTYSHGTSRCCMVPPSTPANNTPFDERSADMLWAVICLTNNVIQ